MTFSSEKGRQNSIWAAWRAARENGAPSAGFSWLEHLEMGGDDA